MPHKDIALNIYNKNGRSEEESKVLISILEKPLSLGDWQRIALIVQKLNTTILL
jgi:thiamine phosphate synthase YjbQ (UPF0047 family)